MIVQLGKNGYPFDGQSFDIDNEMQSIQHLTLDEQADIINVAKEHISKHGAIVQMFIESLEHLWSDEKYSFLLVQLAQLWYEGDSIYRRSKISDRMAMVYQQRKMIIDYYSPPDLVDYRQGLLQSFF